MKKSRKQQEAYNTVKRMIYMQAKIEKAIAEARLDHTSHGNSKKPMHPDPTASEAVNNIAPIRSVVVEGEVVNNPEQWLRIINEAYKACTPAEVSVIESKYKRHDNVDRACYRLNLSKHMYYDVCRAFNQYVLFHALNNNLFQ